MPCSGLLLRIIFVIPVYFSHLSTFYIFQHVFRCPTSCCNVSAPRFLTLFASDLPQRTVHRIWVAVSSTHFPLRPGFSAGQRCFVGLSGQVSGGWLAGHCAGGPFLWVFGCGAMRMSQVGLALLKQIADAQTLDACHVADHPGDA